MEPSPYTWLHCQQSLGLTDTQLRALILADDESTRHVLLGKNKSRYLRCREEASQIRKLQEQLDSQNIVLLSLDQPAYPALLLEISDPPPLLYSRGEPALYDLPCVAVVGSRRPSRSGERDAEAFGAALAELGFCVVSGMAMGVDAAAHRGALAAGGKTLAVLGCGVDVPYPRSNAGLYQQLFTSGQIVSEFPPGVPPLRHQFPKRNRIISGLSLGVLVVEAAEKSGSLITARLALEQNREVFAIPGSIHNPASRGCNALIRQGAQLVETVDDIVQAFSGWAIPEALEAPASERESSVSEPLDSPVYPHLDFEPQSLESIAQKAALPIAELLKELGLLEMEGWAEQRGAMWLRAR